MKKLAALILVLTMALSLTVAQAETYKAGNYYTIDYPDTLTLDDTSYDGDSTAESIWLFMLSNDVYQIDASLDAADGYEGFSLYSASDSDRDAYLKEMLDSNADQSIQLVDTLTLGSGIPFYIYSMEDSDGAYYYAETIANGKSVNFCCYYSDTNTAPDAALLSKLEAVLKTFKPVTSASAASASSGVDATSGATSGKK